MRSIRRQLTTRLLLGLLVVLLLTWAVTFFRIRSSLIHHFDESLADHVRALSNLVQLERGGLDVEISSVSVPTVVPGHSEEYFQLWLPDRQVLYKSPSLATDNLPFRNPINGDLEFYNLSLPSGKQGRAITFQFVPQIDEDEPIDGTRVMHLRNGQPLTLVLARDRSSLQRLLGLLTFRSLSVALLALMVILWLVSSVIQRGLTPVAELADKANQIDETKLRTRFPMNTVPKEVHPIYRCLNELLERLDQAFQRERRFNDNVAHELITPIAELRSSVEVALRWPDDQDLALRSLREVLDIARQQERLVTALLSISRSQSGNQPLDYEQVDVTTLFEGILSSFQEEIHRRQSEIRKPTPIPCVIETDVAIITSILTNLILNALEYSPDRARIEVDQNSHDNEFLFSLTNPAPHLTQEDVHCMFNPLWRKDGARSDSQHSGLGLTLCTAFVASLQGTLTASLSKDHRLRMELRISVAPNVQIETGRVR